MITHYPYYLCRCHDKTKLLSPLACNYDGALLIPFTVTVAVISRRTAQCRTTESHCRSRFLTLSIQGYLMMKIACHAWIRGLILGNQSEELCTRPPGCIPAPIIRDHFIVRIIWTLSNHWLSATKTLLYSKDDRSDWDRCEVNRTIGSAYEQQSALHHGHSERSWTFEEFFIFSVKHLTDCKLLPNFLRLAIFLVDAKFHTEVDMGKTMTWTFDSLWRMEGIDVSILVWRQHICGSQFGKSESRSSIKWSFAFVASPSLSTFQYYLSQPS